MHRPLVKRLAAARKPAPDERYCDECAGEGCWTSDFTPYTHECPYCEGTGKQEETIND